MEPLFLRRTTLAHPHPPEGAVRHNMSAEYTATPTLALTLVGPDAILGAGRETMRRSPGQTAGEVEDSAPVARPTPPEVQ